MSEIDSTRFIVEEILIPDPPVRIGMEIYVNTNKGAKLALVLQVDDRSRVVVQLPNGKILDGVYGRIRDREGFSPTMNGWAFKERK